MGRWEEKYQSIIIFLNRRCDVGCASCNVNARPENKKELSCQWLSSFFNRIEDLKFSGYILWTGGEPFFSPGALQTGISLASREGYHSEILTGASWFDTHPEWLESLSGNANFSIRISLDAEHQERVPLSRVISLIRRAWQLQIQVNFTLREIPGRQESVNRYIEEIKKHLPEFYHYHRHRSRWVHYIPHIPISPRGYGSSSSPGTGNYRQPCSMAFRDLVIGEDGLVYPCCGLFGFPFHQRLAVGDPMKESWESIAARQTNHPFFRRLKGTGPYGICKELNLDPGNWTWPRFQSPCHLCMALFKQEGRQVLKYFSL